MSVILELLFGWVLEFLPLSMSAAARRRAWRRGKRVVLRARVLQDVRVDHIALSGHDGLWLVRNRGFEAESLTKVEVGELQRVEFPRSRFARPDSGVEIEPGGGAITIVCPADWDLLREVATIWSGRTYQQTDARSVTRRWWLRPRTSQLPRPRYPSVSAEAGATVVSGTRVARIHDADGDLVGWLATNPDALSRTTRVRWSFRHERRTEQVVRGRVVFADGRWPIDFYDSLEEAGEYEMGVFTHMGVPNRLQWLSGDAAESVYAARFADWE